MRVRRHSQVVEAKDGAVLVEDPHHALLAPDGGGGGDPDVGVLAVDRSGQLAVLRTPSLHDVHARHDLDPTDESDAHGGRQHEHFLQCAVDPETHPDDVLRRLDVDVRGSVPLGLCEDAGDDLDDRRIVRDDLGLAGVVLAPGSLDRLECFDELVHAADGAVAAVDGPLDVGWGSKDEADRLVCGLRHESTNAYRWLIGDGDLQAVVVELDRHNHVLAHDLLGDELEHVRLWVVPPEVDHRHVKQVGQEEGEFPLVHGSHGHEGLADPLPRLVLHDQGLRDVVLADEPAPDEQRPERFRSACGARSTARGGSPVLRRPGRFRPQSPSRASTRRARRRS